MLSSDALVNPSNFMVKCDSVEEDDDWVVVKKQRITIFIPPPSPAVTQAEKPNARYKQDKFKHNRSKLSRTSKKSRRKQSKIGTKRPAATLTENDAEINSHSKIFSANPSEKRDPPNGPRMKSQRSSHSPVALLDKEAPVNCADHVNGKPSMEPPSLDHAFRSGSIAHHNNARTIRSLTMGGYPRMPIGGSKFVNQRMRALLFERKVEGLGGLKNWLVLCGLSRFIQIFEKEKLGIYQLVGLSMRKLKDMGADAVGPRRKLIHAIDCLCQPYNF